MNNVHIALVGGQPEPIYHVIKKLQPDTVVYVASDSSKNLAHTIKKNVDAVEQTIVYLEPTDANLIMQSVLQLADKYKNDKVTVNISGGLKSWTYFFITIFGNLPNAEILYIDQNIRLWNYTKQTVTDISDTFNLITVLKLRNNPLSKYLKIEDFTEDDWNVCKKIQEIRGFKSRDFTPLLNLGKEQQMDLKSNTEGYFQYGQSSAEWYKPSFEDRNGCVVLTLAGINNEFVLESPHAINLVFNSGWFEYKVARMISKWNKARKTYINCIFPYNDKIDKNEVDIIVETQIKALFVECKTYVYRTTDIDKFKSVVRTYGGTSSMALFITENELKPDAIKKCQEHKILCFSFKNYNNDSDAETELFKLLDAQYHIINEI